MTRKGKWDASLTSFDSGSFSLTKVAAAYHEKTGKGPWAYYETNEFWDYVNAYADFVKRYKVAIDLYSVVDVIGNADLTWRVQRFMEDQHGLAPVPTVHYRTDLKWLVKYMRRGRHPIISLGGLVGSSDDPAARRWLDEAFAVACPGPDFLPAVKLHGFGLTSFSIMTKYPFWSVDSSTWTQIARFGGIIVPRKRAGRFVYTEEPFVIKVSIDSPERKQKGKHYLTMSRAERRVIDEWLEYVGVPLGTVDGHGDAKTWGVMTRHSERRVANIRFFDLMQRNLPKWPWAWKPVTKLKGLGLVC